MGFFFFCEAFGAIYLAIFKTPSLIIDAFWQGYFKKPSFVFSESTLILPPTENIQPSLALSCHDLLRVVLRLCTQSSFGGRVIRTCYANYLFASNYVFVLLPLPPPPPCKKVLANHKLNVELSWDFTKKVIHRKCWRKRFVKRLTIDIDSTIF